MTLPIASVPATALPPDVRNGSEEDKKTYRAALGFEQVLLSQLLREVDALAAPEGTPAVYGGLVSQTLADSLAAGGGIGLARDLYGTLKEGQE